MNIFQEIYEHWKNDWINHRRLFWLELVGVFLNATATATLSIMVDDPPILFCYIAWFIGSGLLMLTSYIRRTSWIFCLMTFYTLMNIVGLTNLVLK